MSVRSLNKAQIIGNLTRDPELRYTPKGAAVCSFGVATNRRYTPADAAEPVEETDFHNVVAWTKLAELCSQLLHKGDKVFVEGRISYRDWVGEDGSKRSRTEIVARDMILLSSRYGGGGATTVAGNVGGTGRAAPAVSAATARSQPPAPTGSASTKADQGEGSDAAPEGSGGEEVQAKEVPF